MSSSVLNTIGLSISFLGAIFLVYFGITFRGNDPGVSEPGKICQRLHLTIEWGQRLGFILLAIGFFAQLIAQILLPRIG